MRFFLALLLLMGAVSMARAESSFAFSNAPGPHAAGLRVVHQYDFTRSYRGDTDPVTGAPVTGEKARPIETLIWYPAQAGGEALRFSDYIRLSATEEDFDLGEAEIAKRAADVVSNRAQGLTPARIEAETTRPMWAVRDAVPASGRFPVVVYAPSFSAPAYENAELCEYLASQGYVVIASPSIGARTRGMTTDVEGLEAQAADIEFLIGYARTLPQADAGRIAVMGFSWGGLANVFAAAKDSRIKALVSLDGSVRYFPDLIAEAKYVTPTRVTAPFLLLTAKPQPSEEMSPGLDRTTSFANKMKYADVYRVVMKQMVHGNFGAQLIAFSTGANNPEYSRDEIALSYSWAARYVLHFLDATLKGDAAGAAFLASPPAQNGVPPHMLTVDRHGAEGPPPTREALATQLAKQGFDHIGGVYEAMHAADPDFQIDERELNLWGYDLLARGRPEAAIAVLKQATILYPKSGNIFDSLADVYESSKNRPLAIENYRKSLALDPHNDHAIERLKALGAKL